MNTLQKRTPMIEQTGRKDHVILLDELEFGMSKGQLETITKMHNEGMDFQDISKEVKRNPYEVIVALLHQAKIGKKLVPLRRNIHVDNTRNVAVDERNSGSK